LFNVYFFNVKLKKYGDKSVEKFKNLFLKNEFKSKLELKLAKKKKYKEYKIINNFILDKNIFNDFKRYFPLKEYLINNNFIDYHDPKFEDDDIFYYIFLCLLKLDNKVLNFLNALND